MTRLTRKIMMVTGFALLLFFAACGDNSSETTSVKPILPGKEYKTYKAAVYAKLDSVLLGTIRQQRTDIIDTVNQQRTSDGLPDLTSEEETEVLAHLFEAFSRHVSNEKSVYLGMFKEEYTAILTALNVVTDDSIDANTSLQTEEALTAALQTDLNKSDQQQLLTEKVSEDFTAFAGPYLQSDPFATVADKAGRLFNERVHSSVMVQNTLDEANATHTQTRMNFYNLLAKNDTNVSLTSFGSGSLLGSASVLQSSAVEDAPTWIKSIRNGNFFDNGTRQPTAYTGKIIMEGGDTVGTSWPDKYGTNVIVSLRNNTLTFSETGQVQNNFPYAGGYDPDTDYLPGIIGVNLDYDTYAEYVYADNNTLYLIDDVNSGFAVMTRLALQDAPAVPADVTGARIFYSVAAADPELDGNVQIYVGANQIAGATNGSSLQFDENVFFNEYYVSTSYHYQFSKNTETLSLLETVPWETSSTSGGWKAAQCFQETAMLLQTFSTRQTDLDGRGKVVFAPNAVCVSQDSNDDPIDYASQYPYVWSNLENNQVPSGDPSIFSYISVPNGLVYGVSPLTAWGTQASDHQVDPNASVNYYTYPHVYVAEKETIKYTDPNIIAIVTPPPCVNGSNCYLSYSMSASSGSADSTGFSLGISIQDSFQVTAEGSGGGGSFSFGTSITGSATSSVTLSHNTSPSLNSSCSLKPCTTPNPPQVLYYTVPFLQVYGDDLRTNAQATMSQVRSAIPTKSMLTDFDEEYGTTLYKDLFNNFDFNSAPMSSFIVNGTLPAYMANFADTAYAYTYPCTTISGNEVNSSSDTCTLAQGQLNKVSAGSTISAGQSVSIIDGVSTAGFGLTFDMQDKLTVSASESYSNSLTKSWGTGFSGSFFYADGAMPFDDINALYTPTFGLFETSATVVNSKTDYFMIVSGWINKQ